MSSVAAAVLEDVRWLRRVPRCHAGGTMVHVTLAIEPSRLTGPAYVAWSAGGLHVTTPKLKGSSVTCAIPRVIFERRALVRLELIGTADADGPVFAWTQIPVLGEMLFRAEMTAGRPVLRPLVPPVKPTASRPVVPLRK